MRRLELTQKQKEALDKIAAAGEVGLPDKGPDRRVTVNRNCVNALYHLGLIVSYSFPLHLTDAGVAAQRGEAFAPARHVYFSRVDGKFWQAPTYNYEKARARWHADVDANAPGHPHMLDSRREDVFRAMFPGVEISE